MGVVRVSEGDSEDMIRDLRSQGFSIKTVTPDDMPDMPDDITEYDDEGLMYLFSKLTERASVVATQLACAIIDESNAEKKLEYEESVALLTAHSTRVTKDTISFLKSKVATDPAIRTLKTEVQGKYNYRKLVEVMSNGVDRDLQLVSRELTRRTAGATFKTRSQNNRT